jgi:hypothetical protein
MLALCVKGLHELMINTYYLQALSVVFLRQMNAQANNERWHSLMPFFVRLPV